MDAQGIQQPQNHQVVMNRFVAACQADERVVAAFLAGSYARGTTDEYSDLDFYLITTDEAYDDFFAGREAFLRLLGEPVFLEDFHGYDFDMVIFIFADGTAGELALGRQSHFHHIHGGPYRVLLDKKRILAGREVPWPETSPGEANGGVRPPVILVFEEPSHQILNSMARWVALAG